MDNFLLIKPSTLKNDIKLYRYLSLSQFMEFIEFKKIYLTNINYWEDEWEAPTGKINLNNGLSLDRNNSSKANDLIGQSWSLQGISDALWKIYSKEKEGIMIQTTVGKFKLIKGIKKAMLAPVIYYENLDKILNEIDSMEFYSEILGSGFLKRKAFEHESEVRLITLNDEEYIDEFCKDSDHLLFELDPAEFIEKIIIDPRAKKWFVDTIECYCKRSDILVTPFKSDLTLSLSTL